MSIPPKVLTETIQPIERRKIRPSPLNPRTHFSDEYLNELGHNVRKNGFVNALLVRQAGPTKEYPEAEFEIIAGECRWRSTDARPHPETGEHMSEVDVLPVVVRNLADHQVLELMMSENIKRKDLTPLEEMAGFQRMMVQANPDGSPMYTIRSLGGKLGVPHHYIDQRLSLRKLTGEGQKALAANKITFETAREICSCPEKTIPLLEDEVLNPKKYDQWRTSISPLSAEEARSVKLEKYVRDLRGCVFDQADPNLLTLSTNADGARIEGGACTDCPWKLANTADRVDGKAASRSGVNERCLNPACFKRKVEIHTAAELLRRQNDGAKLLKADEAKIALKPDGKTAKDSPYVRVDERLSPEDRADSLTDKNAPTWREVALTGPAQPETFVTVTDSGEVVSLMKRQDAVTAASKNGTEKYLSLASGRGRSVQQDEIEAEERERKEAAKLRGAIARGVMAALVAAIEDQGVSNDIWEALRPIAARHAGNPGCMFVAKRLKLNTKPDVFTAIADHGDALVDTYGFGSSKVWAFVLELLFAHDFAFVEDPKSTHNIPGNVEPLLKLYGIDVKAIEREVRAASKEKAKKKGPGVGSRESAEPPAEKPKLSEILEKVKSEVDGRKEDAAGGTQEPVKAPASSSPARLLILGCGAEKTPTVDGPIPAKDLYTGTLFRARRKYAEASGAKWMILSAQHGLIGPETPVLYYDRRIDDLTADDRSDLQASIIKELIALFGSEEAIEGKIVEMHAPAQYVELVREVVEDFRPEIETPLEGLGIGEQMAFYKKAAPSEALEVTTVDVQESAVVVSPPPEFVMKTSGVGPTEALLASAPLSVVQAVLKVVKVGEKCTVATIQRKLKLGYQAALAAFDELVMKGLIEDGKLVEGGAM